MSVIKTRNLLNLQTPLSDIPRTWLTLIEPRIERDGLCWLWNGALDATGRPIVAVRLPSGKRSTARVTRIVAGMFYELKKHHEVVQKCGALNCLNPAHIYVSDLHYKQEDRGAMIKEHKRNAVWYKQRHESGRK